MKTFTGKTVFDGVAVGKIVFYGKKEEVVKRERIEDEEAEVKRLMDAVLLSVEQLGELYEKALKEVGEANAAIFEIHQMMVQDEDYLDAIRAMITSQKVNAEYAVANTGDHFSQMFAAMEDDYMRARAADVKDISERLIRVLSGAQTEEIQETEPVIIIAHDLAPSETVMLDKSKVRAFVTRLGSMNSHTAILARTMNIPALIGVEIEESWNGMMGAVDGSSSTLYIEPDEEIISKLEK